MALAMAALSLGPTFLSASMMMFVASKAFFV